MMTVGDKLNFLDTLEVRYEDKDFGKGCIYIQAVDQRIWIELMDKKGFRDVKVTFPELYDALKALVASKETETDQDLYNTILIKM